MGKLPLCLQKSPMLQCWSQRHVEVVAVEQIRPVLVLRGKSSVCSLWPLSPQNSRCVRASLRPSWLYRGYATHSGESGYVAGLGGGAGSGCSPRGNLLLVSHQSRLLAVGSNSCSHGVCSLLGSVRFRWRKWRWSVLIVEVVGCHLTFS